ncbi:MAG TPA: paraquat-inducible protein A [Methylibium sp.]|uniref:paraquat-inducible protein A n=1 Tax=Methylibium sp. TaxID=2067992 RepID=UPI002DBE5EC8|nr:paraquat-inducible protein A [Methylibium sp.]HEU4458685.1 paraquat-inducible protein A [Methylibium sp.]
MWLCHDCDALQHEVPLQAHGSARCWRCAAVLRQPVPRALDRSLALAVTSAVLFLIAQGFTLVQFDMQGQRHATSLAGAVWTLWEQDARLLAALVSLTTQVLPALQIGALLWVLAPLVQRRAPPFGATVLRLIGKLMPWGMVEVFVLGTLVALGKLHSLGTVVPGPGLWAFGALIFAFAAAVSSFDTQAAWQRLEAVR